MTIYWCIGKFVLGLYFIFQVSLWVAYQFPSAPEVIQETGETLFYRHLYQNLPEYYYEVSQTTPVWSLPSSELEVRQLLDSLLPGTLFAVIDSLSRDQSTDARLVEVAYQDELQNDQIGWIITTE